MRYCGTIKMPLKKVVARELCSGYSTSKLTGYCVATTAGGPAGGGGGGGGGGALRGARGRGGARSICVWAGVFNPSPQTRPGRHASAPAPRGAHGPPPGQA